MGIKIIRFPRTKGISITNSPPFHELRRGQEAAIAKVGFRECDVCGWRACGKYNPPYSCDCMEPVFTLRFCSKECLRIHKEVPDDSGEICHDPAFGEMLREMYLTEVN